MINLVSINRFQSSWLSFDVSAKDTHIGFPLTYLNIVFSETTRPIELKFHIKTPCDWLAKMCTNSYGHVTNMATMPIYNKNYSNIFSSGSKTPMALGLTM